MEFFATAAKGTEGAVRDELRSLRFRGVRADRGGVHFSGPLEEGFRACIELRTAMRVLVRLTSFDAPSEAALYEGARAIDWAAYVSPRTTIAVRATTRSSRLTHSQYVGLKTKDAIVDRIRDEVGSRPDVDASDPDVLVSVHLAKDVATLYLDLGGRSLFMRGYRTEHLAAPLKESLAASLLFLSGWATDQGAFVDPMCGSGTIAIEAALLSEGRAPGLVVKERFGFERWVCHRDEQKKAFASLVDAAETRAHDRAREARPPIFGRDVDPKAIEIARSNAERAGVAVRFERGDARAEPPVTPATIVTNPPYGERIEMAERDWREIARALTSRKDCRTGLLLGHPDMLRPAAREPDKVITLMNGDIEVGFAMFHESQRPRR